jgi:molybdopterin molybdotransferase
MLTVPAALQLILDTVQPFPPEEIPLEHVGGLALAADVLSGVDSPPFDKALMDGYAVQAADVATGHATLNVIERITAGQVPKRAVARGTAIQIMTGAPLPAGADAVVRIEDTRLDGDTVVIAGRPIAAGTSLIRRGTALKVGERVLSAGDVLTPSRIGALAELGCARVSARPRPQVAVLATGDELVPVSHTPGPGQIRNPNEPMLAAQLRSHGATVLPLGVARDDRDELTAKMTQGLTADVLVLSGGVSAGVLDLVPSTLAALGVRQVFHKVDIKPGKPVWFGVLDTSGSTPAASEQPGCWESATRQEHSASNLSSDIQSGGLRPPLRKYVFGLPGNPVSSLVCCELFVRTAIRQLMGLAPAAPAGTPAQLAEKFAHRSDRPTYHPAFLSWTATGLEARLVTWHGSSDLRATVDGNGMVLLETGEREYQTGDLVPAFWWG